jgi:hypothetical protein
MADRFENNADETTAIPRYMSGESTSSGAAGTASGMSMLMGAANIVIKDLITAWDEGVTRPFLTSLYRWNMQFSKDPAVKGDFDVKARGTASLVAKEVRTRQLNEFGALTANPLDAPYIKRDVLNRLRAEANEMSDVVKTEDEIKEEMQGEAAQMQQQLQQAQVQMQMQEAQAKIAKLGAEAELTMARAKEVAANIELIVANAVNKKVEAVYAALQAGGVAVSNPMIAPAGDEILRSSGWRDATPDPSIAQLYGPPVQPDDGEIAVDAARAAGAQRGAPAAPMPQAESLQPQTGMRGVRGGIETMETGDGL